MSGIAQVIVQPCSLSGFIILFGIAVHSWKMAVGALIGTVIGTATAVVPMLLVSVRVDCNKPVPLSEHIEAVAAGGSHLQAVATGAMHHQYQRRLRRFRDRHIGEPGTNMPPVLQGTGLRLTGQIGHLHRISSQEPPPGQGASNDHHDYKQPQHCEYLVHPPSLSPHCHSSARV